ncbi:mediator of RNA polymerase II transcription subunit 15-like [Zerene cesonia]|uniref:mediator of RNA polymerase II transcription subunit 15-like n=1 Tax=Zerene cesonia TaxID=33412 RepID=UPI0018E4F00C|nr:mediator of RNA polymerase II transcription subunit 15-like [Zerene cesonia]
MLYQVALVSAIIALIGIQAKELAPGPQSFKNTNSSSAGAAQNQQKRFATKDVIVYLTPNQIKDLQAGKAELRSHASGEITISKLQNVQKLPFQNPQSRYNAQKENLRAPQVQEEQVEIIQQEQEQQQQQQEQQEQQARYFNLPSGLSIQHVEAPPTLLLFSPESQQPEQPKFVPINQSQESNKNEWIPINPSTEKNLVQSLQEQGAQEQSAQEQSAQDQSLQEQINKQWQKSLRNSFEQGKLASSGLNIQPENRNQEGQQQPLPNYNPLIYALAHENALRAHNNEVEKQRALAQAEAIANSPPVIIHKEVKITKHQPVPVVKRVNVPVPTPVLVPVIHPYEVKVPQPYPVPVEIVKDLPVPPVSEKPEAEKAVPYGLRNHIPGKNVYINVDSPAYLQVWKN